MQGKGKGAVIYHDPRAQVPSHRRNEEMIARRRLAILAALIVANLVIWLVAVPIMDARVERAQLAASGAVDV